MVLLNKDAYQETREITLGHKKKSQILIEFSDWLKDDYDIEVLNFEFGKMIRPDKNYRLCIIVATEEDNRKMLEAPFKINTAYQQQIGEKFKELNRKYRYTDESNLMDLFVTFIDFSHEAKTLANWAAIKKARKMIMDKYDSVWDVHAQFERSVVFYYFDHQIKENEKTGTNDRITDEYYQILKECDEFDYFQPDSFLVKFDSKENLDNNYEGNLFYYDR